MSIPAPVFRRAKVGNNMSRATGGGHRALGGSAETITEKYSFGEGVRLKHRLTPLLMETVSNAGGSNTGELVFYISQQTAKPWEQANLR